MVYNSFMVKSDTSDEALCVQTQIYREMPVCQKAALIFSAYEMGKHISMSGIRERNPQASDRRVWLMWAKQHLGAELFEQVYGNALNEWS